MSLQGFVTQLLSGQEARIDLSVAALLIALLVPIAIWARRVNQPISDRWEARWNRINALRKEIDDELKHERALRGPAHFLDDGERIVVYPDRRRLLVVVLILAFVLAAFSSIFVLIHPDGPNDWHFWLATLLTVLLAGLFVVMFVLSLWRMLTHSPSLIVGPDGILDNGSMIATGLGLIGWDNFVAANSCSQKTQFVTMRWLVIVVLDPNSIREVQPLRKRPLMRLFPVSGQGVMILQRMLDEPVDGLAGRLEQYFESHAPPEWLAPADDEDNEDDSAAEP